MATTHVRRRKWCPCLFIPRVSSNVTPEAQAKAYYVSLALARTLLLFPHSRRCSTWVRAIMEAFPVTTSSHNRTKPYHQACKQQWWSKTHPTKSLDFPNSDHSPFFSNPSNLVDVFISIALEPIEWTYFDWANHFVLIMGRKSCKFFLGMLQVEVFHDWPCDVFPWEFYAITFQIVLCIKTQIIKCWI